MISDSNNNKNNVDNNNIKNNKLIQSCSPQMYPTLPNKIVKTSDNISR